MSNQFPPLSPLNRLAYATYYLPLLLAAVALVCSLPLVFLWGLIHTDSACEFLQGCTRVLDQQIKRMKAARIRLARKG